MVNLVTVLKGITLFTRRIIGLGSKTPKGVYSVLSVYSRLLVASQDKGDHVYKDVHILKNVWKNWAPSKVTHGLLDTVLTGQFFSTAANC